MYRLFSEITEETYDSLAMCDEKAMEEYLESEKIEEDTIAEIIGNRKAYPCYFWFGAERWKAYRNSWMG